MNSAKAQDIRVKIEKQKAYWQTTLSGELPVMEGSQRPANAY